MARTILYKKPTKDGRYVWYVDFYLRKQARP